MVLEKKLINKFQAECLKRVLFNVGTLRPSAGALREELAKIKRKIDAVSFVIAALITEFQNVYLFLFSLHSFLFKTILVANSTTALILLKYKILLLIIS